MDHRSHIRCWCWLSNITWLRMRITASREKLLRGLRKLKLVGKRIADGMRIGGLDKLEIIEG